MAEFHADQPCGKLLQQKNKARKVMKALIEVDLVQQLSRNAADHSVIF